MEEYAIETFANRDAPIPILSVPGNTSSNPSSDNDADQSKHAPLHGHLRPKASDASQNDEEESAQRSSSPSHKRSPSLQERFLTKSVIECPHNLIPTVEDGEVWKLQPGFSAHVEELTG